MQMSNKLKLQNGKIYTISQKRTRLACNIYIWTYHTNASNKEMKAAIAAGEIIFGNIYKRMTSFSDPMYCHYDAN